MSFPKLFHAKYLYAIFVLVATIALISFAVSGAIGQKEIAGSLLVSLGAFLGALFAFRLNESKEKIELLKEQKEALNRALFVLIRQHNAIKSASKVLGKYETEFVRAFNFPALNLPLYTDLAHNFQDLEFLLESIHSNVLMRLAIEQERFHQALESLRVRNSFYVGEVQPEVAKLSLNHTSITMEAAKVALGERIFDTAINNSKTLYEHFEGSNKSILAMHVELFKVAKQIFPAQKFIKLQEST